MELDVDLSGADEDDLGPTNNTLIRTPSFEVLSEEVPTSSIVNSRAHPTHSFFSSCSLFITSYSYSIDSGQKSKGVDQGSAGDFILGK